MHELPDEYPDVRREGIDQGFVHIDSEPGDLNLSFAATRHLPEENGDQSVMDFHETPFTVPILPGNAGVESSGLPSTEASNAGSQEDVLQTTFDAIGGAGIEASFMPDVHAHDGGFITRSGPDCAPFIIADIAMTRLAPGAKLDAPWITPGHEDSVIGDYKAWYGYEQGDLPVNNQKAKDLAVIGGQLLALDETKALQPPLQERERQIIEHLVSLVNQATTE